VVDPGTDGNLHGLRPPYIVHVIDDHQEILVG
jgi:hypothetical protein